MVCSTRTSVCRYQHGAITCVVDNRTVLVPPNAYAFNPMVLTKTIVWGTKYRAILQILLTNRHRDSWL